MSINQQKAVAAHRERRRSAGLVRVEVQAPAVDAPILRALAAALRDRRPDAARVREQLRALIARPLAVSALDVFGSDLPDDHFDGVFGLARPLDPPRDIDL